MVKVGKLCVEVSTNDRIAWISEDLCIGCGICVKVRGRGACVCVWGGGGGGGGASTSGTGQEFAEFSVLCIVESVR